MDILNIVPSTVPLSGNIRIPSDKSISHRSVIFGSLCSGQVSIENFSSGADCHSTFGVLKKLGIDAEFTSESSLTINGKGLHGFSEPESILDAGNSGTTIRLMLGILSGQPFYSVITGDESLVKRPMGRVIQPLNLMGASICARKNNTLAPISIKGISLIPIEYSLPIASAQVKSCLILAGLYADGKTVLTEPAKSRDHTERMLKYLGVNLNIDGFKVSVEGKPQLEPKRIVIPGDISSAAFFLVAASIVEGSSLTVTNVGLNPTRTGILSVLNDMGADITIINQTEICGEPVGDLVVNASSLKGVIVEGDIIPSLIDEIPIIAVAAVFAEGTTIIKDAEDLRNKESDRLKAICTELKKLGADIEETPDGLIINGNGKLEGDSECECYHDHRIAMSLAIAGLAANKPVSIRDAGWIKISFPEFFTLLDKIRDKNYVK
jgi:3-phosphoshikimate 1-carboxyvinyltransferase